MHQGHIVLFSYRVQFMERIKEANPSAEGDNNETIESINLAADSSTEKRDMQLRWEQNLKCDSHRLLCTISINFANFHHQTLRILIHQVHLVS